MQTHENRHARTSNADLDALDPRSRYLELTIERTLAAIGPTNQPWARDYITRRRGEGLALSTLSQYAHAMRELDAHMGGQDYAAATPATLETLRAVLRERCPTYNTLSGKVAYTKAVIAARLDVDKLPRRMRLALKLKPRVGDMTEPPLSPAELRRLLDALNDQPRMQTMVAVLADSGFRRTELLSLRNKNVELDEHGVWIRLPKDAKFLKRGPRDIYIRDCRPYLVAWRRDKEHVGADDPEAYLFPSGRDPTGRTPIRETTFDGYFRRAWQDAGIRHVWPHLLRHTKATILALLNWKEAALRKFFGWGPRSKEPAYYVHLAETDLRAQVLRDAGILPDQPRSASGAWTAAFLPGRVTDTPAPAATPPTAPPPLPTPAGAPLGQHTTGAVPAAAAPVLQAPAPGVGPEASAAALALANMFAAAMREAMKATASG